MAADTNNKQSAAELRRLAEEKVAAQRASAAASQETDMKRLMHELQVHQVELEMQNEELHLANQTLQDYEVHMQNVIKMTPAGYFRLDQCDCFADVNDAWLKMHGYESRDEVIGKHFSLVQVDSESDSALEHLAKLHKGMPIPLGDFTSRRKDGSIGHHIFSAHPVLRAGRIIGFEWFIIDISEHRRSEKEQLKLQQQLQQSQKLESLGVLCGGIAHDFNNILAVIIGHCGLMRLRPDSVDESIAQIEIAAGHAAELCRQMLAYAGKGEMVRTRINFGALVVETVSMLKSTLPMNAKIKLDNLLDIPNITGDDSQIRQIVMNLIINAAEAIGEKQGIILVTISERSISANQSLKDHLGKGIPPGAYLCLEVTDNGCGMDEETMQRMFEPFFSTKFTGRGLGMSAVLGIISASSGAMELFSQPGQGTTFKVYLPVQASEAVADELEILTRPAAVWRGGGTILLAEDEEEIRYIAKIMLEELGFTVIAAVNGKEALELYEKGAAEITLVLTDVGMPLMDGYELYRELKKLNPDLPIIISSGFGDADVIAHIARENLAAIISKPYKFDQLREVLKGVLEGMATKQT